MVDLDETARLDPYHEGRFVRPLYSQLSGACLIGKGG